MKREENRRRKTKFFVHNWAYLYKKCLKKLIVLFLTKKNYTKRSIFWKSRKKKKPNQAKQWARSRFATRSGPGSEISQSGALSASRSASIWVWFALFLLLFILFLTNAFFSSIKIFFSILLVFYFSIVCIIFFKFIFQYICWVFFHFSISFMIFFAIIFNQRIFCSI